MAYDSSPHNVTMMLFSLEMPPYNGLQGFPPINQFTHMHMYKKGTQHYAYIVMIVYYKVDTSISRVSRDSTDAW